MQPQVNNWANLKVGQKVTVNSERWGGATGTIRKFTTLGGYALDKPRDPESVAVVVVNINSITDAQRRLLEPDLSRRFYVRVLKATAPSTHEVW